jgi:hypothetical protein
MKQGGLVWNWTMNQVMLTWGFIRLECKHCIYYCKTDTGTILVTIHIDNFFTVGDRKAVINDFKTQLRTKWTMSDLGAACFCLGIALEWDHTSRTISLSQHALIDKVVKQFSLTEAAPVLTPMEPGLYLSRKQHTPSSDQECELMNWMPYCYLVSPLMPSHRICHSAIMQVSWLLWSSTLGGCETCHPLLKRLMWYHIDSQWRSLCASLRLYQQQSCKLCQYTSFS